MKRGRAAEGAVGTYSDEPFECDRVCAGTGARVLSKFVGLNSAGRI